MENAYQLASLIMLAALLLGAVATLVAIGYLLGRTRPPQFYVQTIPYPTASTGSTGTSVVYEWKAPEPQQAAEVWPEKKPEEKAEPKQDAPKPAPSCYCCNCGMAVFGDPTNQLLIDEVSYLVYGCTKCEDVTLKPLRLT